MFMLLWSLFVGWLLYARWQGRHGTVVPAGKKVLYIVHNYIEVNFYAVHRINGSL